ncbi:MAG: GNAT family N-acetyltransferase [Clostridiaceae bacterium]|nr:GNAT family N-acetyltransferase [Clostridiaceae bacterium]
MSYSNYYLKSIEKGELSFLEDMLFYAIYVGEGNSLPSRNIIYDPNLYKYIDKWDKNKDIGVMVVDEKTSKKFGAAWLRLFCQNNKGYGYISGDIPELSIAIYPEYRGNGLGTLLINHLINELPAHINSISLSVDTQNPAKRLYERLGFKDYSINDGTAIMIFNKL